MTSPDSVGQVSVEIVGELKDLAKKVRKDLQDSVKKADLDKALRESLGDTTVKVPVTADGRELGEKLGKTRVPPVKVPLNPDTDALGEKTRETKVPPVRVPMDPLIAAFRDEVRRQVQSLSRQVEVNVPVTADGQKLRSDLAAQLDAVKATARLRVPTEPGARAEYEAKLRADLAAVSARVKQTVKVTPEVDSSRLSRGGALGGLASVFNKLGGSLPIVGSLASGIGGLVGAVQKLGGSSAAMGGQVAGAFASLGGPITQVVGAILAAQAAVVALVSGVALAVPVLGAMQAAIVALAGAAAALPGALSGIGAAVGTLALGFKGISEAFKTPAGGGGGGGGGQSAAAQARQVASASRSVEAARRGIAAANRAYEASLRSVASAERGLLAAQRALVDAQDQVVEANRRAQKSQEAVNRARRDAKEDIDDLGRALRGAVISEAEATQAVDDALFALNEAKMTGDLKAIARAQNEYDRSVLSLEEAKDTVGDLTAESEESAKKGVEGSDKVQDALEDQAQAWKAVEDAQQGVADAQTGIIDATDALKSAQDGVKSALDGQKSAADGLESAMDSLAAAQAKVGGGAGGVAKEVIKLAPAAQKFVDAVKALKPAFESLRLDVQQRLFAGLDKTVTRVGEKWIPALRVTLGSYADTFNTFFKNLGTSITTPKFISDIQAGAEGFRVLLERVGEAVTSKLVPAFGALSAASAPFLEKVGELLAKAVTKFSEWILRAEKSGKLTEFFDKTASAMAEIATTGKEVGKLIGNIIGILIGGNGRQDKSAISSFNDGLRSLNEWLSRPENRKKIEDFANDLKGIFEGFREAYQKAKPLLDKLFGIGDGGDAKANASTLGQEIGSALVAGIIVGITSVNNLIDQMLASFLFGPDGLVTRINGLLGINSPSTVMIATGQDIVRGVLVGIGQLLGSLGKKALEIRDRVIKATNGAGSWLLQPGKNAVSGLMSGLSQSYNSLKARAAQAKTHIVTALNGAGNLLVQAGRNAISGLGNGAVQMFATLRSRVSQVRGYVVSALNGAGSLLVNAGRNVVIGLYNGIASLGSWLFNKLISFVKANVPGPILRALGINSPSKVAAEIGRWVPRGLAKGIEDEAGVVQAAAEKMAALAVPDVASTFGLGSDFDAAVTRSLSVADRQTLEAYWKPGVTADPVLDGLRSAIGFKFRGDPVAALSS